MRGGTSKGVFVRADDLPGDADARDRFLLALMGSPDPMQIDGLGGTMSSTSKVVAVRRSERTDCDLDYMFFQVGIDRPVVDAKGNCGNLTAAVAPYAIDDGLIELADAASGTVDVRLYNLNTGRRITARVPVADGEFAWDGDYRLDGVPGSAAPITTDYLDPAGAVTGQLFPAGGVRTTLEPTSGGTFEVTIADVTAPVVMLSAADLGIDPTANPAELNLDNTLEARIESVRAAAAVALGFCTTEAEALERSPALPRIALLGARRQHQVAGRRVIGTEDHDLIVRSTSMQRFHHAIPLTTAMCVAAAASLPGTIPFDMLSAPTQGPIRLAHPKGVTEVAVRTRSDDGAAVVESVGVTRTARRLLSGVALVPDR